MLSFRQRTIRELQTGSEMWTNTTVPRAGAAWQYKPQAVPVVRTLIYSVGTGGP